MAWSGLSWQRAVATPSAIDESGVVPGEDGTPLVPSSRGDRFDRRPAPRPARARPGAGPAPGWRCERRGPPHGARRPSCRPAPPSRPHRDGTRPPLEHVEDLLVLLVHVRERKAAAGRHGGLEHPHQAMPRLPGGLDRHSFGPTWTLRPPPAGSTPPAAPMLSHPVSSRPGQRCCPARLAGHRHGIVTAPPPAHRTPATWARPTAPSTRHP